MTRIEQIKSIIEAATPGPWEPYSCNTCDGLHIIEEDCMKNHVSAADYYILKHAREDIPWLLEKLELAKDAIESYVHNFERDIDCDACNNNNGNLSELTDVLAAIKSGGSS